MNDTCQALNVLNTGICPKTSKIKKKKKDKDLEKQDGLILDILRKIEMGWKMSHTAEASSKQYKIIS